MPFRTVVVNTHSKLEYSLNYLVFRTPEETKRILLDEIHTIVIQSTAVSVTTSLLAELCNRKIEVIFCDDKANPICEMTPLYGSHNSSGRVLEQSSWDESKKRFVWKAITEEKIRRQAWLLKKKGLLEVGEQVLGYANEVLSGDPTNREGHAAKVYFNNVFGPDFTREAEEPVNAYLNYGYTILLASFNRAVTSCGYITQLGIHHRSEFNQFNLSCDLMEPFRFLVDERAGEIKEGDPFKEKMISLLGKEVMIKGKMQSLENAIALYVQTVFSAINDGDISKIAFLEGYAD